MLQRPVPFHLPIVQGCCHETISHHFLDSADIRSFPSPTLSTQYIATGYELLSCSMKVASQQEGAPTLMFCITSPSPFGFRAFLGGKASRGPCTFLHLVFVLYVTNKLCESKKSVLFLYCLNLSDLLSPLVRSVARGHQSRILGQRPCCQVSGNAACRCTYSSAKMTQSW